MATNRISEQTILEKVFDPVYNTLSTTPYGYDGSNMQSFNAPNLQIYTLTDGGYTYFCFAAPGTAQATAGWQVFRIDGDGNLMYADANAEYDNIASDPTLLDYSYS